jgi:hypothetical protein
MKSKRMLKKLKITIIKKKKKRKKVNKKMKKLVKKRSPIIMRN